MTVLRVSNEIFSLFPDAVLAVVRFHDIQNGGKQTEHLADLRQAEAQTVQRFAGVAVTEHPHIAPWREAYRNFGAKPKDYHSSIENLVRRVVKGQPVPHINLLVDLYNTVSLRHLLPVGGEDLDKIEGDVELTVATDHEAPVQLLGESEARPPKPGEVIYKDNLGAICRRWNWKEADRTKFTGSTTRGFLVIEGLPPIDRALVEQAAHELAVLVEAHCGGAAVAGMADSRQPIIRLSQA